MKNLFKNYGRTILALLLVVALSTTLCACGTAASVKATDLTFDFQTGAYTFKGVDGAKEYRVRIFPVTEGVESELPINETQAIRGGKDSYSGTIAMWSLTAGQTYNVYVMTTDEDGNNTNSDVITGIYVMAYETIEAGVTATITGNTITVSLGGDALSNAYSSGADYEITLLKAGSEVEKKTLANSDIVATTSGDGSSGTTTYEATMTFDVADPTAEYSVTVKAISHSEVYISSEVSAPFAVTEAAAAPEGGETQPAEGTGTDSEGGEATETQPAETTPAETEGSEGSEGTETQPAETTPAETTPAETEASEGGESEGGESEGGETEPA